MLAALIVRRLAMEHPSLSQDIQECIAECLNCYCTCTQAAMNQCLEEGGDHVQPEHFRLMVNCADLCRTTADFMLSSSSTYAEVCSVCADGCDACAESCREMAEAVEGRTQNESRESSETPAPPH